MIRRAVKRRTGVTTNVTQVIGMYQQGDNSTTPGGGGSPPPQANYSPLGSPWLAHQVHWGLNYLHGCNTNMATNPPTADWAGAASEIGSLAGTNWKFMQDGGKINYSVSMLPGYTIPSPYSVNFTYDSGSPATLARGAAGDFNSHWGPWAVSMANNHTTTGSSGYPNMHDIWLNLGWECNINHPVG